MTNFTPPYIVMGLYERERRIAIEAPNRATIAAIYERRAVQKRDDDMWKRRKELHDQGMHWPGYCPWCPANVYYD